jgi:hypothetical protein
MPTRGYGCDFRIEHFPPLASTGRTADPAGLRIAPRSCLASTHMSKQFFTYIRLYQNIYTNSNIGQ